MTVMRAADSSAQASHDPFWERSARQLLRNGFDLLRLSQSPMGLTELTQILRSAPDNLSQAKDPEWQARSYCFRLLEKAEDRTLALDDLLSKNSVIQERRLLSTALKFGVGSVSVDALKSTLRRAFATACVKAGLQNVTPYTLRHTGATLLLSSGVPPRQVSGMLGHSEQDTTEMYGKHHPSFLNEAKGAVDRLFGLEPSICAPNARKSRYDEKSLREPNACAI